jgi:hypothetical protein
LPHIAAFSNVRHAFRGYLPFFAAGFLAAFGAAFFGFAAAFFGFAVAIVLHSPEYWDLRPWTRHASAPDFALQIKKYQDV